MADRLPLTDLQWRAFRDRIEELAEHMASRSGRNPEVGRAEMAELLLVLIDRLDDLAERLSA